MDKEYTLRELAKEADVPERTIRFYISRGLLNPPLRGGRGAAYSIHHKNRLEEIRTHQARGMMLSDIAHALAVERGNSALSDASAANTASASSLPEPVVWKSFRIDDDVVVMLRAGASPWRMKRLVSELRRFSDLIKDDPKKEIDNE